MVATTWNTDAGISHPLGQLSEGVQVEVARALQLGGPGPGGADGVEGPLGLHVWPCT